AYVYCAYSFKLKDHIKSRNEQDDIRYSFLIETLNGIHTIKSYGLEEIFLRRYQNLTYKTALANYNITDDQIQSLDYGFGAQMAVAGSITMGTLIACILLSGRLMQPVQRAFGLWSRMQEHEINEERIKELFSLPIVRKSSDVKIAKKDGLIEFKNVSFTYSNNQKPIFENITLTIKPNECISISGMNSIGKSTILKMIAGLYLPTKGEVLIDNISIKDYPSDELVNQIGYIPTQGTIYEGTIRDNLTRFGQIPLEQAIEVASMLGIDKEISLMVAGYDTLLQGQNTDNITPGLRQRIVIARAIASKPRVILFDSADRALDKEDKSLTLKHKEILKDNSDPNLLFDFLRSIGKFAETDDRLDIPYSLITLLNAKNEIYDLRRIIESIPYKALNFDIVDLKNVDC
ncbi:ABC transporter related protein, partial [Reticulomyxa filosa]